MPYGRAVNSYVNDPPGSTISKTPSMFEGWMPWKWIVCGCEPPFVNSTRSRSSSVARSTGPGIVPLYVHPGKNTPGAIRQRRRRLEQRVEVMRPAGCGHRIADHRGMAAEGGVLMNVHGLVRGV